MMAKRVAFACTAFLILTVFLMIIGANSASAHFNTLAPDTDVQLHWPLNDSYSMSVDLKILKSPGSNNAIYWGHQFEFQNNETGYVTLGLGETTKLVSFGIFGAIQGLPNNSSGVCDNIIAFLTTGIGSACYLIYNWNIGYNYQLRVSRVSDVNGSERWQGTIYDYSSNSTSIIGNILVPMEYGQLGVLSSTWDEYAVATACNTVTTSAVFSHPYALNSAGNNTPTQAKLTYGNSTCQDSNVKYLGDAAYEADAGNNVTRSTPSNTLLWNTEPVIAPQSVSAVPEISFAATPLVTFIAIAAMFVACPK